MENFRKGVLKKIWFVYKNKREKRHQNSVTQKQKIDGQTFWLVFLAPNTVHHPICGHPICGKNPICGRIFGTWKIHKSSDALYTNQWVRGRHQESCHLETEKGV